MEGDVQLQVNVNEKDGVIFIPIQVCTPPEFCPQSQAPSIRKNSLLSMGSFSDSTAIWAIPSDFYEKERTGQRVRQMWIDSWINCFVAVWPGASHFTSLSFTPFICIKCGYVDNQGCKEYSA